MVRQPFQVDRVNVYSVGRVAMASRESVFFTRTLSYLSSIHRRTVKFNRLPNAHSHRGVATRLKRTMIGWFLLWDYFDLAGNLDKFINQGHGFLDDIIHAMRCLVPGVSPPYA